MSIQSFSAIVIVVALGIIANSAHAGRRESTCTQGVIAPGYGLNVVIAPSCEPTRVIAPGTCCAPPVAPCREGQRIVAPVCAPNRVIAPEFIRSGVIRPQPACEHVIAPPRMCVTYRVEKRSPGPTTGYTCAPGTRPCGFPRAAISHTDSQSKK